jgi:hypothetical protein
MKQLTYADLEALRERVRVNKLVLRSWQRAAAHSKLTHDLEQQYALRRAEEPEDLWPFFDQAWGAHAMFMHEELDELLDGAEALAARSPDEVLQ